MSAIFYFYPLANFKYFLSFDPFPHSKLPTSFMNGPSVEEEIPLKGSESLLKLLYCNFFENFILGRVLAHDSYNCGFLNINKTKGFPTQRLEEPSNFVGSNSGKMGSPMLEVCPPPCRPFDHKDWIYC